MSVTQETEIRLSLTLREINAVLAALGQCPYAQVASVVQRIQAQATESIAALTNEATPRPEE